MGPFKVFADSVVINLLVSSMQQRGPLIYGGLLFGLSGPSE
jgi:hypothetical protein